VTVTPGPSDADQARAEEFDGEWCLVLAAALLAEAACDNRVKSSAIPTNHVRDRSFTDPPPSSPDGQLWKRVDSRRRLVGQVGVEKSPHEVGKR
jgi:hypothetical protein